MKREREREMERERERESASFLQAGRFAHLCSALLCSALLRCVSLSGDHMSAALTCMWYHSVYRLLYTAALIACLILHMCVCVCVLCVCVCVCVCFVCVCVCVCERGFVCVCVDVMV